MLFFIKYISGCESGCRLLNYIKDHGRQKVALGVRESTTKHTCKLQAEMQTQGGSIREEGRETGKVREKLKINVKNTIMNCKFK